MTTSNHAPKAIAAFFMIAVLVAVAILFNQGDPDVKPDTGSEPPASVLAPAPLEPAVEGETTVSLNRAEVAPLEDVIDEVDTDLPASFRKALSGIVGRVVDADGTPMPNLNVELWGGKYEDLFVGTSRWFDESPPELAPVLGESFTNTEGRFQFDDINARGFFLLAVDPGGMLTTLRLLDNVPESAEIRDIGDIVLEPYVTFTGKVEDYDGNPIPNARVRATDLPAAVFAFGVADVRADGGLIRPDITSAGSSTTPLSVWEYPPSLRRAIERFPAPTTMTDAEGSFELMGVPSGVISVIVDKRSYVTLVSRPTPSGAPGGTRSLGTLRIDEGEELTGRVIDANGAGIAGAKIMAGPRSSLDDAMAIVWSIGTSDANGSFAATGFGDAEHFVAALPPGSSNWLVAREIFPGLDEAVIRSPAEVELLLTVTDEEGGVIANPQILAHAFSEDTGAIPVLSPPVPVQRDPNPTDSGAIRIRGLTPRTYSFLVRADGYGSKIANVDVSRETEETTVVLTRSHALPVHVVEASNDQPVEHALVMIQSREVGVMREMPADTKRTDARGDARLTGLELGTYEVIVRHPGFATTEQEVTVLADSETVTIALFRGGSITGRIHANGKAPPEPLFIVASEEGHLDVRFGVSELDGTFEFHGIRPGEVYLEVTPRRSDKSVFSMWQEMFMFQQPEGKATVTVAEGATATIDINLSERDGEGPFATITGRVILNGKPAARCSVASRNSGEWQLSGTVLTDDSGRFDLGEVKISENGAATLLVTPAETRGMSPGNNLHSEVIEVAPNSFQDVIIEVWTGSLRGKVVAPDGTAVAAAQVTLSHRYDENGVRQSGGTGFGYFGISDHAAKTASSLNGITSSDGWFEFPIAPSGEQFLSVKAKGFTPYSHPTAIEIPRIGKARDVMVKLTPALIVAGKVIVASGPEPGHIWISFTPIDQTEGGITEGISVSTNHLAFESDELGAGRYRIDVSGWSSTENGDGTFHQFEPTEITIPAGGTRDLEIVVTPMQVGDGT